MKWYKIRYWQEQTSEEEWGGYIWQSGCLSFRTNAAGRGLWIKIGHYPWHLLLPGNFYLPPSETEALDKLLQMGFPIDTREEG